jgi:hypothetical protein
LIPKRINRFLHIDSMAKVLVGAGIFHNCPLPVKTLGRVRAMIGGRGFSYIPQPQLPKGE